MLNVVCWKWNGNRFCNLFTERDVNRLRLSLERYLHVEHRLICITEDARGIDPRVKIVPMPRKYEKTIRCRRRMEMFSRSFASKLGSRILAMDLDMVIVDDITPIVDRPEPLVLWKVGYAQTYAGAFILMDAGVLDDMWKEYEADPERYPALCTARNPSDMAMLNRYLEEERYIPHWTERDGFTCYFGEGYEDRVHHGVGPKSMELPEGTRIVALGGVDVPTIETHRLPWIKRYWTATAEDACLSIR